MTSQKNNGETTLDDVKKAIDRLAIIELIRAGATRAQIRDVMGSINNQTFSKLHQAVKKSALEREGE